MVPQLPAKELLECSSAFHTHAHTILDQPCTAPHLPTFTSHSHYQIHPPCLSALTSSTQPSPTHLVSCLFSRRAETDCEVPSAISLVHVFILFQSRLHPGLVDLVPFLAKMLAHLYPSLTLRHKRKPAHFTPGNAQPFFHPALTALRPSPHHHVSVCCL